MCQLQTVDCAQYQRNWLRTMDHGYRYMYPMPSELVGIVKVLQKEQVPVNMGSGPRLFKYQDNKD